MKTLLVFVRFMVKNPIIQLLMAHPHTGSLVYSGCHRIRARFYG